MIKPHTNVLAVICVAYMYIVIYILIAVSDAHTFAFAILVATIGKYVCSRSVQVHKEIHKSARFDYKTLLQYIKMNLIACMYNGFTKHDIHKLRTLK